MHLDWPRDSFVRKSSFALVLVCGLSTSHCQYPPEEPVDFQPPRDLKAECVRGARGSVVAVACDFEASSEGYASFLRGESLPAREKALRSRMPADFDDRVTPAQARRLERFHATGSYMIPYSDAVHDVAGWELLDRKAHFAMVIGGVGGRLGVALSDLPADRAVNVDSVMNVLGDSTTLADVAGRLDTHVPFALGE